MSPKKEERNIINKTKKKKVPPLGKKTKLRASLE